MSKICKDLFRNFPDLKGIKTNKRWMSSLPMMVYNITL